MDKRFIHAKDFNRIRTFDEQVAAVPYQNLRDLGSIYVENRISTYCCGLLHRHYDLKEDHVMAHEAGSREGNEDMCKSYHIQALEGHRITPHSWYLNDELDFVPFEYEIDADDTARAPLPDDFLTQLKHFLVERGLQNIFAVVPLPKLRFEDSILIETLNPEIQGTTSATFSKRSILDKTASSSTTVWSFCGGQTGDVRITEVKECEQLPTGLHKIVKKPTSCETEDFGMAS